MLVFGEMRPLIELLQKLLTENLQTISCPFSDLKPLTAKYIHQVWRREWDEAVIVFNKLHEILLKSSDILFSFCKTRKEDSSKWTAYCSLLFDAFHHFGKKKGEEEPSVCIARNTIITNKHILIESADLVEIRKNKIHERSSGVRFWNVNPD